MGVASLLLIIIISGRFVSYLADAATGRFASDLVFSLILFKLPSFASLILPVGLFIGILLSYGQLYVDSEMVVIKACGISKKRLLAYIMGPAAAVMLVVGSITLWLAPLGNQYFIAAWQNPDNFSGLGTLLPGKFERISGNNIIYMGGINKDKTKAEDVFLFRTEESGDVSLVRAKSGQLTALNAQKKVLDLRHGELFKGQLQSQEVSLSRFMQADYLIEQGREDSLSNNDIKDVEALSTLTLTSNFSGQYLVEFLWRISVILLVPISSIIAVSLSETSHRKGRYAKLLPAILLFMLYLGLMILAKNEGAKGGVTEYIILFPHVVFLCISLILYFWFECRSFFRVRLD